MRFTWVLFLAGVLTVHADTIQDISGKAHNVHVLAYANSTFECEDEQQTRMLFPTGTIQSIDFTGTNVAATLETRGQGQIKAALCRYDKAAFNYKDATGKDVSVSAQLVTSANFADGNGKAAEQVTSAELDKYIVQGKVTIVDFYADWCGSCRFLSPRLEDLVKTDDGVVLRKINVEANRELAVRNNVHGLPHVVVFDKDGKSLGTVVGPDIDGIKELVTKAKGKTS